MKRVDVVCRGTFTDRTTGETIHGHEPAVCHTFTVTTFRGEDYLLASGNQVIDRTDNAPFPDDFELLDEVARTDPGRPLQYRLAINCPLCERGLTSSEHLDVVRGIVKTLTRHGRTEVDMESLRGYLMT